MALKSYKPTTPGQRGLVLIDRSELWKGRPVKTLTVGLTKTGGRNNTGRITMWHKGGGAKRLYRVVDFKRRKWDAEGTVERLEYDPNRTAFIALIRYADGELSYILAPQRLRAVADFVDAKDADTGSRLNRRAAHQFTLSADHTWGAWRFGAAVLQVGARPDHAGRREGRVPGPDVAPDAHGRRHDRARREDVRPLREGVADLTALRVSRSGGRGSGAGGGSGDGSR